VDRIDQIGIQCSGGSSRNMTQSGNDISDDHSFTIPMEWNASRMYIRAAERVDHIEIEDISAGKYGGDPYEISIPYLCKLTRIFGRYEKEIDSLGFEFSCPATANFPVPFLQLHYGGYGRGKNGYFSRPCANNQ